MAQYNVDRLLTSGRIALHYEDYVLSIQYFNQAINQKPYMWEPWQLRAIAKYCLEDCQGAEEDATQAIKRNPYIDALYDLRGITYIRQQKYDAAISDYSEAIALAPHNKGYHSNRAACYIEKHSIDTALIELDAIISRWQKYAPAYLMKAEAYLAASDTVNAEAWLDKTLAVENYNADAWRMKGILALQKSQWKSADSCLSRALHYKPKNVRCYINRAMARYNIHNLRGAMDDYNTAVELSPNNIYAHYNRALLRMQIGDDNKAIEDFDYVLSLEPENIIALFNRALLLDRTGNLRRAIRDYSVVIKHFPNFWTGRHYRAQCYRKLGMNAKAERDEYHIFKAQMNKHQGVQPRWSKTKLKAMRRLSDIDPEKYDMIVMEDDGTDRHEYDSAYRGKVQNKAVSDAFQPYLALTLSDRRTDMPTTYIPFCKEIHDYLDSAAPRVRTLFPEANLRLGEIGENTGSVEAQAYIDLPDSISDQLFIKAIACSSALDYQEAFRCLSEILNAHPDSVAVLWQRAVCGAMLAEYHKSADPSKNMLRNSQVEADFNRLMALSENNALILYCYGTYHARSGNHAKAVRLLTQAISLEPSMPYAYYNRALAYRHMGKMSEAQRDFSKSGELGLYGAYSMIKHSR